MSIVAGGVLSKTSFPRSLASCPLLGSYSASWVRSLGTWLQFCEAVQKSASGKSAPVIAVDKETGSNSQWILAFENQVFIDEFFWPVQPLGISHLQTPVGRRFLNAVSRVSGSA